MQLNIQILQICEVTDLMLGGILCNGLILLFIRAERIAKVNLHVSKLSQTYNV